MTEHRFQINLRGIIDLLSNHLYSTPETFVRELLQNGVDAIAARRMLEPDHTGELSFEVVGGAARTLIAIDDGIGLTEDEVHRFLATIGESSKRLADGAPSGDFIGRFGIGLLSCFVVAEEIVIHTRSARVPDAPSLEWKGKDDGTYNLRTMTTAIAPGTRVYLRARADAREHFTPERIRARIRHYGELLPVPIIEVAGGARTRLNAPTAPWRATYSSLREQSSAMLELGERMFESKFLDWIPLTSASGKVEGVAFVIPHATHLAARHSHRIYLRHMLLSESADDLLPDWAFFVRCVVDAHDLRPTASRENFYPDAALERARAELGGCLRAYLLDLVRRDPATLRRLIAIHHHALKALASVDGEFFAVIADFLPFETTKGTLSIGELKAAGPPVRYAPSLDQFRQIAGVAAAQGMLLVNAGYVHDSELMERLALAEPALAVEPVDASSVAAELADPTPDEREAAFGLLRAADEALRPFDCRAELKRFRPAEMPVLYSQDREATFRREVDRTKEVTDDLWGGLLDNLANAATKAALAELVFNVDNALVRRLAALPPGEPLRLAIEMLYVQALLLGHHPLKGRELALLNKGLSRLIDRGLDGHG